MPFDFDERGDDFGDGELYHYGTPMHSGRYPYGSGEDPNQHTYSLESRVRDLKKSGMSEVDIATALGYSNTSELRKSVSISTNNNKILLYEKAKSMKEHGKTTTEIAAALGKPESTVRGYFDEAKMERITKAKNTAEFLKKQLEDGKYLDVGAGTEQYLNISRTKLDQALDILKEEGYSVYGGRFEQVTNKGKFTTQTVLTPPGVPHKEIFNLDEIKSLNNYVSKDNGETFEKAFQYPESLNSKRMTIRYAEDGGTHKDGVVEIRRGVDDLSLGESRYSQVRILVDGTHYIKGMAVYADDLPDGVDVRFNTNKTKGTPLTKVLKEVKQDDPVNPFGSLIKSGINDPDNPTSGRDGGQSYYYDKKGNKKLSLINKRADEGDWNEWSNKVPSQFLAKQNKTMIKKQLDMTILDKQSEYDDILTLENPTVKAHLLNKFADDCDGAAVHLKAAKLPRQQYHVILPVETLKDTEIFAPKYKDGEKLALVRFPHGGTFEIPVLTVNNKNKEAQSSITLKAKDAVGINHKVAEVLSGADFDGDTVLVIPTDGANGIKVTRSKPLKELKGFDPKTEYAEHEGMTYMKRVDKNGKIVDNTQIEMGKISNLITDMTIKGATDKELARAVKHSMVVIDAAKHKLDYTRSAKDNRIDELKKLYQGIYDDEGNRKGGASTLLSRASAETHIDKRKGSPRVNEKGKEWYDPKKPEGSLIYKINEETYKDKKGNIVRRKESSTEMMDTDDAYTLSSGTAQEEAYASYANTMKRMANQARLEKVHTKGLAYDEAANKKYKKEVNALIAELSLAEQNKPRERDAQRLASTAIKAKVLANPDMTKKEKKKVSQLELEKARLKVGAKRTTITMNADKWAAIQAGAITQTTLKKIIENTDIDTLKAYATPKTLNTISQSKINKIKAMAANGYSTAEIAEAIGKSTTTVLQYID